MVEVFEKLEEYKVKNEKLTAFENEFISGRYDFNFEERLKT